MPSNVHHKSDYFTQQFRQEYLLWFLAILTGFPAFQLLYNGMERFQTLFFGPMWATNLLQISGLLIIVPLLPAVLMTFGLLNRRVDRTDLKRVLLLKLGGVMVLIWGAYYILAVKREYFWDRYFNNAADRKLFFGIVFVLVAYLVWSALGSYLYRRKNGEDKTMLAIKEERSLRENPSGSNSGLHQ